MQDLMVLGFIVDITGRLKKLQSHWSVKYRSRSDTRSMWMLSWDMYGGAALCKV